MTQWIDEQYFTELMLAEPAKLCAGGRAASEVFSAGAVTLGVVCREGSVRCVGCAATTCGAACGAESGGGCSSCFVRSGNGSLPGGVLRYDSSFRMVSMLLLIASRLKRKRPKIKMAKASQKSTTGDGRLSLLLEEVDFLPPLAEADAVFALRTATVK